MNQKQVVLVTGVSSGIGRVTAGLLARSGFQVFGSMREGGEAPPEVEAVRLDIRDEASVRSCVRMIIDRAGRIDALVNNAGVALFGSVEETSIEEAKQLFETNFFGVLRMSAAALPIMREQQHGRIVTIGSVVGFVPAPYQGIYAASKHAVEGYSESLDHEVRQFGIRVSVIEPGFTKTDIIRNSQLIAHPLKDYAKERTRVLDAVHEHIADGGDPGRVASVVLQALTSRAPRLRYPVGREAALTSRLRAFAPAGVFDKGLRKQFGLTAI